jgi:pyruvate/2-oxoglutarate dehydrogenase complex dihydrolipoamide acyltransferase (E2) component
MYSERIWPTYRNDILDFLELGKSRNPVYALVEADITRASRILAERRDRGVRGNSTVGYLLWCIGRAVRKHPEIHAIRRGRKLILFDDVDIALMVEKTLPGGERVPIHTIFRAVQKMPYSQIAAQLRSIKEKDFSELMIWERTRAFLRTLPAFLRVAILKLFFLSPRRTKRSLGTVALTSVGMILRDRRFWPIPIGPYPCLIASGAAYTASGSDGERTMLCLTIGVDHNLIDGAVGARFVQTLVELLEGATGLDTEK